MRLSAEVVQRTEDLGDRRVKEDVDVAGVEVTELAQDLGHALRVVLREVKRLLSGAARVAAHHHGVGVRSGRRGDGRSVRAGFRRAGQQGGGEKDPEGPGGAGR